MMLDASPLDYMTLEPWPFQPIWRGFHNAGISVLGMCTNIPGLGESVLLASPVTCCEHVQIDTHHYHNCKWLPLTYHAQPCKIHYACTCAHVQHTHICIMKTTMQHVSKVASPTDPHAVGMYKHLSGIIMAEEAVRIGGNKQWGSPDQKSWPVKQTFCINHGIGLLNTCFETVITKNSNQSYVMPLHKLNSAL